MKNLRILYISDNPINGHGGGTQECRKHFDALKILSETKGYDLKIISPDSCNTDSLKGVSSKKKRIDDLLARALGHSSYLYVVMRKYYRALMDYKPDIVYLSRSRFGFAAKEFKKKENKTIVITNIDNVEFDYAQGYFSDKGGILKKLLLNIEKMVVKRDESDAIKYSDRLVFLTRRNILRYHTIYGYHVTNEETVLPICMETTEELDGGEKKTIVFIGSLDYEPNIQAVLTIVNEVWKKNYLISNEVELVLAGRNPDKRIISCIDGIKNIIIHSDYDRARDVIPRYSLMLAPIEKGYGMKVKVADALRMGLLIACSDEAMVGYEDIIDKNPGLLIANCVDEYLDAIKRYISLSSKDMNLIEKKNKLLFERYYSLERSRSVVAALIEETILEKDII